MRNWRVLCLLASRLIDGLLFQTSSLPNPKRSTLASQKLQHKKLTTPFRSPAMTPKIASSQNSVALQALVPKDSIAHLSTPLALEQPTISTEPTLALSDTKRKHRTQRASAPFKSPLSNDASAKLSSVRMTPSIQALERQVQLLRRAIKVRDNGEAEILLELVKKWTEAGRDVAWEVWELVKDKASEEAQGWGKPNTHRSGTVGFEDSWGWSDKKTKDLDSERNWGWDVEPGRSTTEEADAAEPIVAETDMGNIDDSERQHDTLGTMLMQLGIVPGTLGWNEEEGQFQDMCE
ncbi:hypothetical protein C0991_006011 [Blastosporella zonata]|nr:hypothetical protein C0991_006011 [Blastosporella zonata]